MEDPAKEIDAVVYLLTAADSPNTQKQTLEKYMTPDVAFRHPLCEVQPGDNSREEVLRIYQWYRILSPRISISVRHVSFDPKKNVLYLDIVQWFKLFPLPNSLVSAPARLITRLKLRRVDGLYYIAEQEDFYHPSDFAALLLPVVVPIVRSALRMSGVLINLLTQGAQFFGYWRPSNPVTQTAMSDDRGLYMKDD